MTVIAPELGRERTADDAVVVALAAKDRPVLVRLARALATRPELVLRCAESVRELVARGAADDLLVYYCQSVSSWELDLFKELKHDFPDLPIIVVCEVADGRAARRLVDGGIEGFVYADELEAALAPTIGAVLAGQLAVPRAMRSCVRKASLSARERQILGLVVMGCTNSEISGRMYLAESTVKSHLSSAYNKIGARSRSEAVALITDPKNSLDVGILAVMPEAQARAA